MLRNEADQLHHRELHSSLEAAKRPRASGHRPYYAESSRHARYYDLASRRFVTLMTRKKN